MACVLVSWEAAENNETEGDEENLEPHDSKMHNQYDNQRLSHLGQGKEQADDVMKLSRAPDEVNQVNSVMGLHFLGNLLPTESGINQVQAAPGFVWKPATSKVDPGAINNEAPSSVSAKALVEQN